MFLGLQDIRNFALTHPDEIILLDLTAGPALVQPGITNVPIDDARIPVFAALILDALGDLMFSSVDLPSANPTIDELLSVAGNKNLIFIVGDERLPLEDPRFIISIFVDTFEPCIFEESVLPFCFLRRKYLVGLTNNGKSTTMYIHKTFNQEKVHHVY